MTRLESTGGWTNYLRVKAGTVKISQPGLLILHIRPIEIKGQGLMNLRSVRLVPTPGE